MNHNFYNSNSLGFDQTRTPQFPVIHPPPQETSIEILHDQENVLLLAWDRVFEIPDAFGNKQYKPEDIQELFRKLLDDLQNIHEELAEVFEIQDAFGNKQYKPEDIQELFRKLLDDLQNIHEELAEYINSLAWNRHAFYDDDDDDMDYTITITPVLSTEEPDNSLNEVIKSSVKNLAPIPSESEGIPNTMCDVHLVNNPTLLEAKDHCEIVINSNDDYSSSDDDSLYYKNIEYVESSPYDSELVSLEIEALKDNHTPSSEFLTKSSSTSPRSFMEETNTCDNSLPEFENFCFDLEEISSGSTTTHSDISLPEYEAFSFNDDHIKEISSGSATTHSDISLSEYDSFIFDLSNDQFPSTDRSDFTHEEFADELAHIISPSEYDCFYFRNLPDPGEWISSLNSKIHENLSSTTRVNLPVEDDHSPLLVNEDTIFDPGITINRFYSFKLGLSHRCGTFKKFNTHRSHLNESPMEILFSTFFPMDQASASVDAERVLDVVKSFGMNSNENGSGGDVFDLIGDVDPTDKDGDIRIGDSTGVSTSLDGEIFSGEKKCRESNIGDSDNTGDGGKIVAGIGRKGDANLFCCDYRYITEENPSMKKTDEGVKDRRARMQGGRLWRVLEATAKNEPQGGDVYFLEGQGDDVGAW
nr:hypothetical protein [Tanacetum cinerariifolium]